MHVADGIRSKGFRGWYERQLIEGHVCLVTGLMSAILVLSCVEILPSRSSSFTLWFWIAAGAVTAALGLWRYQKLLFQAECFAGQSTCTQCDAYGLLEVIASGGAERLQPRDGNPPWVRVRCKRCEHVWRMEGG